MGFFAFLDDKSILKYSVRREVFSNYGLFATQKLYESESQRIILQTQHVLEEITK